MYDRYIEYIHHKFIQGRLQNKNLDNLCKVRFSHGLYYYNN